MKKVVLLGFFAMVCCAAVGIAWAADCDLKSYREAAAQKAGECANVSRAGSQDNEAGPAWVSAVTLEEPRAKLEEKGITFEAAYAGDMVSNLSGGLHRKTTYIGNLDLALTLDLEKAGLIRGGKFFVSGNNSAGGENPSEKYIGDLQGVDNIEAPDAMRLYEWWYEQTLFGEKLAVLVGVQGLDSEFGITDYGSAFINSSFGTPPDISANLSIGGFPYVGPAARIKYAPSESFDFKAAIFDGDPSDGGKNRHGVRYRFSEDQGLLLIMEAAYHQKVRWNDTMEPLTGNIKFGSWLHTQNPDDVLSVDENGDPIRHRNDYGFYGIIDQMIFREKGGDAFVSKLLNMKTPSVEQVSEPRGLGLFLQFGGAPDDRNTVDYYFGAGLNYTGLIPGRWHDVLGVGVANAFISERARKARDNEIEAAAPGDEPSELLSGESVLETTYRIQLTDRLALQPDYQVVFHPSAEQNVKTAHVFLLRFEVAY
jgi:porin